MYVYYKVFSIFLAHPLCPLSSNSLTWKK